MEYAFGRARRAEVDEVGSSIGQPSLETLHIIWIVKFAFHPHLNRLDRAVLFEIHVLICQAAQR